VTILSEKTLRIISKIGPLDILIGTPSFNNEDTIGHVAKAIKLGLIKYFPSYRSGLVHLDAKSTDKTVEKMKHELKTAHSTFESILIMNEHHPSLNGTAILPEEITVIIPRRGKGNCLRGFFEIAQAVGARACAVFDSDLRSITPEWVSMMIGPVIRKDYDYVTPQYCRHKYDGTITNSIVYPLTTTLYGTKVRQPIGGEFGFSSRAVDLYLQKEVPAAEVTRFGIDIWMTTTVMAEKLNICQSFLGAKIHDPKDPSASLGPMFRQVIGTMFELMPYYRNEWNHVKKSSPVKTFGFGCTVIPEEIRVNREALVVKFQEGFGQHDHLWSEILTKQNLKRIANLRNQSVEGFRFPKDLWVKTVYDFAVFYNSKIKKSLKNEAVLSLVPLYFAYTASFVNETLDCNFNEAEKNVEKLCEKFMELKPYLISRWDEATNQKMRTKKSKRRKVQVPVGCKL